MLCVPCFMIVTIIIAILGFSILILVHELGHFFAALQSGMEVEEFGIGFPPRIWAKKSKKSGVEYSINWIPFGGFVRIKGENTVYEKGRKPEEGSFKSKSVPKRMLVAAAGVFMNLLLAILVISILHISGMPSAVKDSDVNVKNPQVQIMEVAPESPAEKAGIKMGDIIKFAVTESRQENILKMEELIKFSGENKGKEIALGIIRDGEEKIIKITPREVYPEEEGAMGISLLRTGLITTPWYKAPVEAVITTWELSKTILSFLGNMIVDLFTRGKVPADIVGPVGIMAMSGKIASMGISYSLWIFALISVNLFLVNLLPIPALDGGRLLFLAIEGIKGSPVSQKFEESLHLAGFILLILLMILITVRDVIRLF